MQRLFREGRKRGGWPKVLVSLRNWGLLTFCLIGAVILRLFPALRGIDSCVLGGEYVDLVDEIWLQQAAARDIFSLHFFYSHMLNFPDGVNLVGEYFSYLHVYFTVWISYLLPWPLWWNCVVIIAIVTSSLSLYWCVRTITTNSWIGVAAALCLAVQPWTIAQINYGYLNQLWLAPFFITIGFLHLALQSSSRPGSVRSDISFMRAPLLLKSWHYWLAVVVGTVVTSLVYWLYGFFLAIVGALMICADVSRLSKRALWAAVLAVGITLVVVGPLAKALEPYQRHIPNMENKAQLLRTEGRLSQLSATPLFADSSNYQNHKFIKVSGSQVTVPMYLVAWIAVLLYCEYRWKNGVGKWLLVTFVCVMFSFGPYLNTPWGILCDAHGNPVWLPYKWLTEVNDVFFRWSRPVRIVPCCYMAYALSAAALFRAISNRHVWFREAYCQTLVAALFLGSTFYVPFYYYSMQNVDKGVPFLPQVFDTPSGVPDFARFLKKQPFGAVVDLPIGYWNNVHEWQTHHAKPLVFANKVPMPNLMSQEVFLQYLLALNALACQDVMAPALGAMKAKERGLQEWYAAAKIACESEVPISNCRTVRNSGNHYWQLPVFNDLSPSAALASARHLEKIKVRYIVLHRDNCGWIDYRYGNRIYKYLGVLLREHLGKPIYSDYQVEIFTITANSANKDRIKKAVRRTWPKLLNLSTEQNAPSQSENSKP